MVVKFVLHQSQSTYLMHPQTRRTRSYRPVAYRTAVLFFGIAACLLTGFAVIQRGWLVLVASHSWPCSGGAGKY